MSDTGMYDDAIVDDSNDPDDVTGIIINDDLTVVRRGYCRRCTYINNDADVVCQACDLALVANPFATVDAILVNQIRYKVEEQLTRNILQKKDDLLGDNATHQQPINDQILHSASQVSIIEPVQWCLIVGCDQSATLCRPFCLKHDERRFCENIGCTEFVRGWYKSCFAHGGGRRCSHLGCDKIAHDYCVEHCDGKRCRRQYKFDALGSSLRSDNIQKQDPILSETAHQKTLTTQEQHNVFQESIIEIAHCYFSGCDASARSRRPYCLEHSGNRLCNRDGDDTRALGAPTYSYAAPGGSRHYTDIRIARESKRQEQHTTGSQEHNTISQKSISEPTQCRIIGCNESATSRRPYCLHHSGNRTCEHDGCNKCSQGLTRYCITHGGGSCCTFPGCDKRARVKLFCKIHGGDGKCCSTEGCMEFVVGGSSFCTLHDGKFCDKSAPLPSTKHCVEQDEVEGKSSKEGCENTSRGRIWCPLSCCSCWSGNVSQKVKVQLQEETEYSDTRTDTNELCTFKMVGTPTLAVASTVVGTTPNDEKRTLDTASELSDSDIHTDVTYMNQFVVHAPAGKLGLVVDIIDNGAPVVYLLKNNSALIGQVNVGDRLIGVDEVDVRILSGMQVSKLVTKRSSNLLRKLTFVRGKQE